eukprot:5884945-Pyramimonas_sp.AAC.2
MPRGTHPGRSDTVKLLGVQRELQHAVDERLQARPHGAHVGVDLADVRVEVVLRCENRHGLGILAVCLGRLALNDLGASPVLSGRHDVRLGGLDGFHQEAADPSFHSVSVNEIPRVQ